MTRARAAQVSETPGERYIALELSDSGCVRVMKCDGAWRRHLVTYSPLTRGKAAVLIAVLEDPGASVKELRGQLPQWNVQPYEFIKGFTNYNKYVPRRIFEVVRYGGGGGGGGRWDAGVDWAARAVPRVCRRRRSCRRRSSSIRCRRCRCSAPWRRACGGPSSSRG